MEEREADRGEPPKPQDSIGDAIRGDARARQTDARFEAARIAARRQLVRDLNHALTYDSPSDFASRLFSVVLGLKGCGITDPNIARDTTQREMGHEFVKLCHGKENIDLATIGDLARRRAVQIAEQMLAIGRPVFPPETVARWTAEHDANVSRYVDRFFSSGASDPQWRSGDCGLSYLRWGIWRDLAALARMEEEDGRFRDPNEPLDVDDPGLSFHALCAKTAADIRSYQSRRITEPLLRLPIDPRRNLDRIRRSSALSAPMSDIPWDLSMPPTEICDRLVTELDRMGRLPAEEHVGATGSPQSKSAKSMAALRTKWASFRTGKLLIGASVIRGHLGKKGLLPIGPKRLATLIDDRGCPVNRRGARKSLEADIGELDAWYADLADTAEIERLTATDASIVGKEIEKRVVPRSDRTGKPITLENDAIQIKQRRRDRKRQGR